MLPCNTLLFCNELIIAKLNKKIIGNIWNNKSERM
nr:MAG TPA: hypothetical protein [Bacteriophage sp.]